MSSFGQIWSRSSFAQTSKSNSEFFLNYFVPSRSHMRQVPAHDREPEFSDTWIVCNQSTKHPDAPENQGGCLRVGLTVCFVCDTIIEDDHTRENATRANLTTKLTYCSVVNPGGWAPASVLRAVYKREYPKFLKRFTQYVIDKTKAKPILW